MRALVSSTPGYGHVLPMVPIARALAAAGHEVLWATGEDAARLVSEAGFATAAAGLTQAQMQGPWQALMEEARDVPQDSRAGYLFPKLFGRVRGRAMVGDLLRVAREWQPDLLLHEQGELAAPLVAAVLGVPAVVHAFGTAVPAPHLTEAGNELAAAWAEHGQTLPPYAGCFESLHLDIYPPSMQPGGLPHVARSQPLRPVSYTGEDPGELRLPPGDGPLVYVTLGTVFNKAPVLAAAMAALGELGVRVVATVGPKGDVAAVGPQPPTTLVETYVSQSALLPRCDAVVSHAGSGTVLGALTLGLPQVCLPQAADQFRNARAVSVVGAGVALGPAESSSDAIRSAVHDVLHEPRFRAVAEDVAAEIARMPLPAEVVPVLEELVS